MIHLDRFLSEWLTNSIKLTAATWDSVLGRTVSLYLHLIKIVLGLIRMFAEGGGLGRIVMHAAYLP